MRFIVIIPSRYHSTRLPGKPMLDIAGKPMLQHVAERATQSGASAVYVATDDQRIMDLCKDIGVTACMTGVHHASGTDRIEEACRLLDIPEDTLVVNVQGDEPLIPPAVINQVANNLDQHQQAGICTLYEHIHDQDEVENPNVVKLVSNEEDMALYFSRSPIPYAREGYESIDPGFYKRHVGIYAYRIEVLRQFVQWPHAVSEVTEKLEQLRALHHGVKIHVAHCCEDIPPGVDTQADLEKIRNLLQ